MQLAPFSLRVFAGQRRMRRQRGAARRINVVVRNLLPWLLAGLWVAAVSLLDAAVMFVYLPFSLFAVLGVLAVITGALLAKANKTKTVIAAVLVLGYACVLPQIKWNFLKSFYIDCACLREGMTLSDARSQMREYLEIGRQPDTTIAAPPGWFNAHALGIKETRKERESRIVFIPSNRYSADWCMVYPKGDQVARVEISPD